MTCGLWTLTCCYPKITFIFRVKWDLWYKVECFTFLAFYISLLIYWQLNCKVNGHLLKKFSITHHKCLNNSTSVHMRETKPSQPPSSWRVWPMNSIPRYLNFHAWVFYGFCWRLPTLPEANISKAPDFLKACNRNISFRPALKANTFSGVFTCCSFPNFGSFIFMVFLVGGFSPTPLKHIIVKMGSSSPVLGVKTKHVWSFTT